MLAAVRPVKRETSIFILLSQDVRTSKRKVEENLLELQLSFYLKNEGMDDEGYRGWLLGLPDDSCTHSAL